MPELPEVETVARQLAPLLAGRKVLASRVIDPLLRHQRLPRLVGRTVRGVSRSGKRVLIAFSPLAGRHDELWLAVHLRMTGRLIWHDRGERTERLHLRAAFRLDRGSLLFYDTRRFGTLHWFPSREAAEPTGTDPLSPKLSPQQVGRMIGSSRQNIKAWLLRQDRLVGLGNIYASEILYEARISPHRQAASLGTAEHTALLRSTRRVLRRAIRNSGTTFSDFQDARGLTGSYQRYLRVYDRAGEPCRGCGGTVVRVVQQQRSTYYCPECQR